MSTEREPVSVSPEQLDAFSDFLQYLFEEDVVRYWSTISKVDQARVYGMYIGQSDMIDPDYTFHDYVKNEFMVPQREIYETVKENAGFAQFIRYSEEGEPQIFMKANVTEKETYNEPTPFNMVPITLTLDTHFEQGEAKSSWKVRMYSDQLYKNV